MAQIQFEGHGLEKLFSRRKIFSAVDFSLVESDSLAIAGRNGSGKSTLLKILAHVLAPTRGKVSLTIGGGTIKAEDTFRYIGLVAPYLQMYDEFTALENLRIFRDIRGLEAPDAGLSGWLDRLGLGPRSDDLVRTYSSGMKQRLKFAFALLHQPPVLLLDEPSSNLDSEGIAVVYDIIKEQQQRGIVIIATNDDAERKLCRNQIDLNVQQKG